MQDNERLKALGLNIKRYRLKQDLSQEKLAELVDVSHNLISLIENGNVNPTILKIIAIAEVLNVDINTLIKEI